MATAVSAKGATALFLFNTSAITDNVQFNKRDKSPYPIYPCDLPYQRRISKSFTDNAATIDSIKCECI